MEQGTIKGRVFSSETKGLLDNDGYWSVTVEIKEKATLDGVEWFEETIDAMSIDKSFDNAHQTALRSVLQWMEEYVYSRGFNSLIEAKWKLREATENGKPDPDQNPAS